MTVSWWWIEVEYYQTGGGINAAHFLKEHRAININGSGGSGSPAMATPTSPGRKV